MPYLFRILNTMDYKKAPQKREFLKYFSYFCASNKTNRMTITVTQLYQLLSKKLNQETAEALTSYIATSVTENVKKEVDTKAATFVNKEDIARYKSEVKDDLYLIRKDMFLMKEDIFKEIHKIRSEANQNKFDLIKWFISLFITLALMIIGLYLK